MRKIYTILILLSFSALLYSQKTITGRVEDKESGGALPGVSILVQGTTRGVISDLEGNYTIEVSEGDVLMFSFIGYITQEFTVTNQTEINVILSPDLQALEEIVVIGYTTQKKSLVTGAISKVDAEDLNKNQVRIEQALQGKTAGVNIMQESGSPGAGLTVRIRGTSTNGNSDPLFIVDGMRTSGIEYLNANDIESVEILKDAASAAIYGAEAANGVVLVTTKKGKKISVEEGEVRESQIQYSFNYGIQQIARKNEVLNAKQYATFYREGLRHEIQSNYVGIDIPDVLLERNINAKYPFNPDTLGAGTNWLDEIYTVAPQQEHNLSIMGGSDNTSVFASGSFLNQDGIVGGSKANFKRYTARLNVNHEANNWLSFGGIVSFTHFKRTQIDENNEFGGVISNAMNIDPLTPVYVDDTSLFPDKYKAQIYDNIDDIENSSLRAPGNKGYYGMSPYVQNEIRNPVAQLDNKHDRWYTDKLLGNINASIKPIKGLVLKSAFDIDLAYGNKLLWTPRYYYHSINFNYTSSTKQENNRWFTWQWENIATYSKQIEKHNVMLLGGMTVRDYSFHFLSGLGENLQEESWNFAVLDAVLSDSTRAAAGGRRDEDNRLLSYFGRVQYNYDEKYMVDLVLRSDASSKLSKKNRTQYFPSVSLGWTVSNEDFWTAAQVNFLKLRLSWGQNGTIQSLDNFGYVSLIKSDAESSYYLSGGSKLTGSEPEALSNPDLVWETSQQTDIGLDVRFFNNRLSLTTDFYLKKTIDLITDAPIPEYVGNKKPKANAGEITNRGVETELIYKSALGDLSFDIGANAAFNENEVTSLDNTLLGTNLGTLGALSRSDKSKPIWYFHGFHADGIFDSFDEINAYVDTAGDLIQPLAIPGDVKFRDVNGDGEITEDDKGMIGSPHPDWIFGMFANLYYKNFDFSISFNGTLGNDVYYGAYRTDLNNNNKPLFFYEDAWTPDNNTDLWPRYSVTDNNNNFSHNSLLVFNGSYIRLQNLELGYTLPMNISQKAKIKKLRLYVSGKNLFILTKYPGSDPEIGNSSDSNTDKDKKSIGIDRGLFPKSRIISFGLHLTL